MMRIVVKIGTSSVTDDHGAINNRAIETLCNQVAQLREQSHEVLVVTSGAVAGGVAALGMSQRPSDTQTLQALAAVGQSQLMNRYNEYLSARGMGGKGGPAPAVLGGKGGKGGKGGRVVDPGEAIANAVADAHAADEVFFVAPGFMAATNTWAFVAPEMTYWCGCAECRRLGWPEVSRVAAGSWTATAWGSQGPEERCAMVVCQECCRSMLVVGDHRSGQAWWDSSVWTATMGKPKKFRCVGCAQKSAWK